MIRQMESYTCLLTFQKMKTETQKEEGVSIVGTPQKKGWTPYFIVPIVKNNLASA